MKTYNEVIDRIAKQVYNNYMGGSHEYYRLDATDIVAFIFNKKPNSVTSDIMARFEVIRKEKRIK